MGFSAWQRPFVDGPSLTAMDITLAAVVLVAMLPTASHLAGLRKWTTRLIALSAFANLALSVGYLAASHTWTAPPGAFWPRPSAVGVAVNDLPVWGLAVVSVFLLQATRRQTLEPSARDEPTVDAYLVDGASVRAKR